MKVGYWPFWSQQCKTTGKFLRSCGNVRQLTYLAGNGDVAAVPHRTPHSFRCETRAIYLPIANPLQRIHWDTEDLYKVFHDRDVAVTSSEYLSIPLRKLFPRLRIIQLCNVVPDNALFLEAFEAADLVVMQSEHAAQMAANITNTRVTWWPMAYDAERIQGNPCVRDIDVFFAQRCSADNSTHHVEFLEACDGRQWNVFFSDVTGWLQKDRPNFRYSTDRSYVETLFRSRVTVHMHRSWYGGISVREAIAAGCVPVVLRTPAYVQLFGPDWLYYVDNPVDSDQLRHQIEAALTYGAVRELPDVTGESYQAGAKIALKDIHDRCA